MLKKKSFKPRPAFVSGVLAAFLLGAVSGADATWLSAYGTPDKDAVSGIFETDPGDYMLLGVNGASDATSAALVARLDPLGSVLWSKRLPNGWTAFPGSPADPDAIGFYNAKSPASGALQWARLRFDRTTGAASPEYVKALSPSVSGNFSVIAAKTSNAAQVEHFVAGTLALPPNTQKAADVVVAKLAADGTFAWSRILNFGSTDTVNPVFTNAPKVLKLPSGYLVSWSITVHQLFAGAGGGNGLNGIVLARLDDNGNLLLDGAGKARTDTLKFFSSAYRSTDVRNIGLSDWAVLSSGDIVVGAQLAENPKSFFLARFDSNLALRWAQTYADPSTAVTLTLDGIAEAADGSLEIRTTRTTTGQNNNPVAIHPFRMALNAGNGAISSQQEIQVKALDSLILSSNGNRGLLASGSSKAAATDPAEALLASFDTGAQPVWAQAVTGIGAAAARIKSDAQASGYLLNGSADTFGKGQGDLLAGTLDADGDANACAALRDDTPVVQIIPGSAGTLTLTAALDEATTADKGPLAAAVTAAASPAATDAGLAKTGICEPSLPVNSISVQPPVFSPGTTLTLTGKGFGDRRSKAFIGRKKAKILSWSDTQIVLVPKTSKAGGYTVKVLPKGQAPLTGPNVTLVAPKLRRLGSPNGTKGQTLAINGNHFGALKPKVRFVSGRKAKSAKVLAGWSDNTLQVRVPSLKPGTYQVQVITGAGTGSSTLLTFTVQ